jgi:hypothetical protein
MTDFQSTPRAIVTPHPKFHTEIPDEMTPVEFFNSQANLENLTIENGVLRTPEDLLLFRKLIGHSLEFDTAIMLDTSSKILDPLGRPVRHTQVQLAIRQVWNRMSSIIFDYMMEKYPDPREHLILCGEASLDNTWSLNKPGVPSIRMVHNHFMVFPIEVLKRAESADPDNLNLTDGGYNSLFLKSLSGVYRRFLDAALDFEILVPASAEESRVEVTGYPQGLPSWKVKYGDKALKERKFWQEYRQVLKGFLDFYRAFFGVVSRRDYKVDKDIYFPNLVDNILLFSNDFHEVARMIRETILKNPHYANNVRWQPAYKQLLYRNDKGDLIVTIGQNSIGNAITELLGIVVGRVEDNDAYLRSEPALIRKLLEVTDRLVMADLGQPLNTAHWADIAARTA